MTQSYKLTDLNNHLFVQLERLGNDQLNQDELEKEVSRTKAIVSVSEQIIDNARIALDAAELVAKHGVGRWENMLPVEGSPELPRVQDNSKQVSKPKQGIPDYSKEEMVGWQR